MAVDHRRLIVLLRFLWAALAAVVVPACGSTHGRYDYSQEPDPRKKEFVLGPSDVLRINVWRNPELSGDVTVRPDGTISVPLVGDLRAAGRTPSQVRADLAQRMTTFIKEDVATVTVGVLTVNSYRFVISGSVERQGAYTSSHYVTVVEALALAGGPNRFASPESIVIIRPDPEGAKGPRRIPVDYPGILSGVHPEEDLTIMTGDTVFVP
jgi:polysaccharide export outer membrane protein